MAHGDDTIQKLGRPRLLVLGDIMLDRYTWGRAERISPEAPVMVMQAEACDVRLGGAGAVAGLLRGLEAEVALAGVVGEDQEGQTVRQLLEELAIGSRTVLTDGNRCTTLKERFLAQVEHRQAHQILRVDREQAQPLAPDLADFLFAEIERELPNVRAVLISDYAKGTCSPALLTRVIGQARQYGLPVLIDPARMSDYSRYRGATVLKPNRRETELATGCPIRTSEDGLAAGRELVRRYALQAAIITLDAEGLVLATADGFAKHVPTQPRAVCDITGAGDMTLAALGLCLAAGWSLRESVRLANVAAGLEVERLGVVPVTRQEIADCLQQLDRRFQSDRRPEADGKLVTLDVMNALASAYRRDGKTVVFTNGCFDLLHIGHVTYLQQAAALGDVLVVAVNSDESVRRLKGPERPIVPQHERAALLAALACVDHVLIFEEATPHRLLECIRPDVLVKGGTTTAVVGSEIVTSYGGAVRILDAVGDVSTTQIVTTIRHRNAVRPKNT